MAKSIANMGDREAISLEVKEVLCRGSQENKYFKEQSIVSVTNACKISSKKYFCLD